MNTNGGGSFIARSTYALMVASLNAGFAVIRVHSRSSADEPFASTPSLREIDPAQHNGAADELGGPDRLAEELPGDECRHHGLDQEAHRRKRRGQVRERVGDEP